MASFLDWSTQHKIFFTGKVERGLARPVYSNRRVKLPDHYFFLLIVKCINTMQFIV